MASAAPSLRRRAELIASKLPPLLVAAERVAATVAQGVHGRRRVGQGETFWQFRGYEPGDPPQLIDWRQSAKTDRVFVRELEWEAAQSVWIWRDLSPSMAWRSSDDLPHKRDRADLLSLALSVLLVTAGERIALLGSSPRPVAGRAALSRLADALERQDGPKEDLPPLLPLPRHAQLVMVGDLLAPLDRINTAVRTFAERGVRGHLFQVLDPAERQLPYQGRIRFTGLEGEAPWLVSRVESVRDDYQRRITEQCDGLSAIARAVGWTYTRHHTDHPPQTALLALYVALSQNLET